jgi:hypothetical protein
MSRSFHSLRQQAVVGRSVLFDHGLRPRSVVFLVLGSSGMDWIYVTKCRNQWMALVNTFGLQKVLGCC